MGNSLALGTAQFGLPYGVANRSGQQSSAQGAETLRIARRGGIGTLDTAISYGESEQCLGSLGVEDMQVMSKLPPLPERCRDVGAWVRNELAGSLRRLRLARLYSLSLHRPDQLLSSAGPDLFLALSSLKDEGLVQKIGVSIYHPDELGSLLGNYQFDLVQAPVSVLDRRILDSGWIDRLGAMGVELHARSIFLQGLLLMPASDRPAYFQRWQSLFDSWDAWLADSGLSPVEACVRYALSVPGIAKVVVGVDGPAQLEQVLGSVEGSLPEIPSQLRTIDPDLLNPSRWPPA